MRNIQMGRGLVVAMTLGLMMVAAKPAFADTGMGGPNRDTCFFAQGVLNSIPAGTPGKSIVVSALTAVTGCDATSGMALHE
jgi:succinyl-CoA synthetase beta subunit